MMMAEEEWRRKPGVIKGWAFYFKNRRQIIPLDNHNIIVILYIYDNYLLFSHNLRHTFLSKESEAATEDYSVSQA
jgi:hypothetical protein